MDSQTIKTSGVGGEERGYDGGKKVKGRKRHILVDTEGFVLKVKVHSAKIMDFEKGSRRCWSVLARSSHTFHNCGWTLATGARTKERTGSRRPWDGVWSWSNAHESLPPRKCLWDGLKAMVTRGREGRLGEADATQGLCSAAAPMGRGKIFCLDLTKPPDE